VSALLSNWRISAAILKLATPCIFAVRSHIVRGLLVCWQETPGALAFPPSRPEFVERRDPERGHALPPLLQRPIHGVLQAQRRGRRIIEVPGVYAARWVRAHVHNVVAPLAQQAAPRAPPDLAGRREGSMQVNQYGTLARRQWMRWLPARYAAGTDPRRVSQSWVSRRPARSRGCGRRCAPRTAIHPARTTWPVSPA